MDGEDSPVKKNFLKEKKREIEDLKTKMDRLTDLIASSEQSTGIKALMDKLEEYGSQLEKLKSEKLLLEEDALMMGSQESFSDPKVVLANIDSIRKENFRKATLSP